MCLFTFCFKGLHKISSSLFAQGWTWKSWAIVYYLWTIYRRPMLLQMSMYSKYVLHTTNTQQRICFIGMTPQLFVLQFHLKYMETLICMCLANCLCSLISLHSCSNLLWTSSNNLPSWRCLIQGSKSECIYMAFIVFIGNLPEFELRKVEGPYKVHKVTRKIANSGFFLCQLTDHFLSKWPVLSSNVDQTSWW